MPDYFNTYGKSPPALWLEDCLREAPKFLSVVQRNLTRFNTGVNSLLKDQESSTFHQMLLMWRQYQIEHVKSLPVPELIKSLMLSLIVQKYKEAHHQVGLK